MAQDPAQPTDGVVTLEPHADRPGVFSVVVAHRAGRVVGTVGVAELPGRCDAALSLPGGLALARVDGRWWRVAFARRGGLVL